MCVSPVSLTVAKFLMRSNLEKKGHILVSSLKVGEKGKKMKHKCSWTC